MVATIDLAEFFSDFTTDYLPDGIRVRLVERDSDARARKVFIPIIGTLEPSADVAATEIIPITGGQARWDLHWDILPDYLGGPADGLGLLVTVGGTSFSFFIAMLLGYLSIQNNRMRRIAGSRKDQLTRESALFQLTLDAIDQGIAVWNTDERLV